jgi:hypothetical protein
MKAAFSTRVIELAGAIVAISALILADAHAVGPVAAFLGNCVSIVSLVMSWDHAFLSGAGWEPALQNKLGLALSRWLVRSLLLRALSAVEPRCVATTALLSLPCFPR